MALAAATSAEHRYQTCRDEDCDRFPCRIYREGYRNGREDGYAEGYDQGFPDGIAACPLSHEG
jgi:flagellar biosynthesis/type III secretory pathway protein FliH